MKRWVTIKDLLRQVGTHYSNPQALNFYEKGQWHGMSTEEVLREIRHLSLGLHALGIKKGECIGLMAPPSSRWMIANIATMIAGGTIVPLFTNISEENFIFQVSQTNLKTIFVDRHDPSALFDRHRSLIHTVIEMAAENQDETAIAYDQLVRKGEAIAKENPHLYQELEESIREDDLAAIIFTSATTGTPKGAELTQHHFIQHLFDLPIPVDARSSRFLNILPLAHIFGYALNLMLFGFGASIYYLNDLQRMGEACRTIHPTLLVVVPRILEKVYNKMLTALQTTGFMQRHLGQWAFDLANQESESMYKQIMHPIADKIVYSHLRHELGGSIEAVICGGASLNPHLNHFFQDIGIPIYEGWGLTEACPITVNRPGANKIGTVGFPLDGCEIKINPEGEVLVRGPLLMRGYYKNPEATARAIDLDGWLHTGDRGSIDAEGYLTLKGRMKEMYKTSTGEWVAPVPIEQMLCKAPLIDMAMVIGEGRKYVSCLLFPNKEVLHSLKQAYDLSELSDEQFLTSDFVFKEMNQLIETVNKHLNHWEQIHAYCFIPHPPSIEAGEITPSLKLRREVIVNKYQHLIDAMYPEEAVV